MILNVVVEEAISVERVSHTMTQQGRLSLLETGKGSDQRRERQITADREEDRKGRDFVRELFESQYDSQAWSRSIKAGHRSAARAGKIKQIDRGGCNPSLTTSNSKAIEVPLGYVDCVLGHA